MFTLKLYQGGPIGPAGRSAIIEVAGVWIDHLDHGIKCLHVFRKTVGVQDDEDPFDFWVGGDPDAWNKEAEAENGRPRPIGEPAPCMLILGSCRGGNHFGWGVLENAMGKTTEMFR